MKKLELHWQILIAIGLAAAAGIAVNMAIAVGNRHNCICAAGSFKVLEAKAELTLRYAPHLQNAEGM